MSFLLRLWPAGGSGITNWQASLEIPATAKRVGFSNLECLFAYLIEIAEDDPTNALARTDQNCDQLKGVRMQTAIQVQGLEKRFGGFAAVNKIDFEAMQGEIFTLLGPNGAESPPRSRCFPACPNLRGRRSGDGPFDPARAAGCEGLHQRRAAVYRPVP